MAIPDSENQVEPTTRKALREQKEKNSPRASSRTALFIIGGLVAVGATAYVSLNSFNDETPEPAVIGSVQTHHAEEEHFEGDGHSEEEHAEAGVHFEGDGHDHGNGHDAHDHEIPDPTEGLEALAIQPEIYGIKFGDITFAQWKDSGEDPDGHPSSTALYPANGENAVGYAAVQEFYGPPIENGMDVEISFKGKSLTPGTVNITVAEKGIADISGDPKPMEIDNDWDDHTLKFTAEVPADETGIDFATKSYFIIFESNELNDITVSDLTIKYTPTEQ